MSEADDAQTPPASNQSPTLTEVRQMDAQKSITERFESKAEISPSGCWEWKGYKDPFGRGVFQMGRTQIRAHRAAWEIYCGLIPPRASVLHHCDNPSCVNPEHLFLGDQNDNMKDMVAKGRSNRGEKHWNSKLTADTIREIRRLRAEGETLAKIATRFSIPISTTSQIVNKVTWKNV